MASAVRIRGLKELDRDFGRLDKAVQKELREELKEAAEPIARTAEEFALREISNIGSAWASMRVVARSGAVYVAPLKRSRKRGPQKRPNLAPLLMGRAMEPALEHERPRVEEAVERMIDRVADQTGFRNTGG